jgi:CAP-Gly domain-containing linker protein 1
MRLLLNASQSQQSTEFYTPNLQLTRLYTDTLTPSMSKLPTLSTPGRQSGSASTGLPTPTTRRSRSSLGPQPGAFSTPDAEMDSALREVLRNRPPSSMKSSYTAASDDPDTPIAEKHGHPPSSYLQAGLGKGLAAPRTPAARSKTPSSLGLGLGQPSAPTTPSTSRASSRPSISGRPSFAGSGLPGPGITPRRTPSMASSVSGTTPYGRRPESRASAMYESQRGHWAPAVGENVRIDSQGFEGTLRYLGPVEGKEGVFAGVELSPGFAGRGKNDGTVDGYV